MTDGIKSLKGKIFMSEKPILNWKRGGYDGI